MQCPASYPRTRVKTCIADSAILQASAPFATVSAVTTGWHSRIAGSASAPDASCDQVIIARKFIAPPTTKRLRIGGEIRYVARQPLDHRPVLVWSSRAVNPLHGGGPPHSSHPDCRVLFDACSERW